MDNTTGTTTPTDQNELTFNQLTVPWRDKNELEIRKKSLNDILIGIDQKSKEHDIDTDLLSPESNMFFK